MLLGVLSFTPSNTGFWSKFSAKTSDISEVGGTVLVKIAGIYPNSMHIPFCGKKIKLASPETQYFRVLVRKISFFVHVINLIHEYLNEKRKCLK